MSKDISSYCVISELLCQMAFWIHASTQSHCLSVLNANITSCHIKGRKSSPSIATSYSFSRN